MLKNTYFTSIFAENRQDCSGFRVASQCLFSRSSHIKMLERKESHQSLQKNGQDSSSFRVAPHSFSSFRFSECSKEQNVKIPPVSALRLTVSLSSGFHRLKCSKEENLHQSLQQIRQNSSNFSVAPRLKFETAGKSGNVRQFSVCW